MMRKWYDGYRSGGTDVYNPWSVIGFLDEGEAQPYWTNTSMNGIVRWLVRDADEQPRSNSRASPQARR